MTDDTGGDLDLQCKNAAPSDFLDLEVTFCLPTWLRVLTKPWEKRSSPTSSLGTQDGLELGTQISWGKSPSEGAIGSYG